MNLDELSTDEAVEQLLPVHEAQVITYLKLSGLPVGLCTLRRSGCARQRLVRADTCLHVTDQPQDFRFETIDELTSLLYQPRTGLQTPWARHDSTDARTVSSATLE